MAPGSTFPANYPTRWESDVALADGGIVALRPVRPDDAQRLVRFHSRQSAQSIYFRFFSPRPTLPERDVAHFTTVDYEDRMAFIAVLGEEMIAVARYDRLGALPRAEVAFFVDDDHHGRGLATVLLEYLAVAAKENGITGFVASVLPENRGMISVFRQVGFEVATTFADGVVQVELGIEPTEEGARLIEQRAGRAEARSVARLLRPRSVAVIGAGRDPESLGHQVLARLQEGGFEGVVYPVNPAVAHVRSVRAHRSVHDIPDDVDLAVVAVPAEAVAAVVEDCARKRVDALVVLSAGFAGAGPDGVARERALVVAAHRHGMRLLGPASVGVLNNDPAVRLAACAVGQLPPPGRIALSTQSGSLGMAIVAYAAEVGLGLSCFVSLGNKADVSGNDLLQFWEDDENTAVIVLYVESFGNPRKFFRICRRVGATKPIVVMRTGSLPTLQRGPAPERGSGAWPSFGDHRALMAQAGVIETSSLTELFDVARFLDAQPVPAGRRVGVVANSTGTAALAAETARRAGLEVTAVDRPATAGGEMVDVFVQRVVAMSSGGDVDAVLVVVAPPAAGDGSDPAGLAAAIESAALGPTCPVALCLLDTASVRVSPAGAGRIPRFRFPEDAARALAHAATYGRWRAQPLGTVAKPQPDALRAVRHVVDDVLAGHDGPVEVALKPVMALLEAVGIEPLPGRMVTSEAEALAAAAELGLPVALKAVGRDRLARSVESGLALNVRDTAELGHAYNTMRERLGSAMGGALVQAMGTAGIDAQVVGHQDPSLGSLIALGRGGTAGDEPGDLAVRLVPLTDIDAGRLVRASSLAAVLPRLHAPAAVAQLEVLLSKVGTLLDLCPEIRQLRLDPVLMSAQGVQVTDVVMVVATVRPPVTPLVRRLMSPM